jgi:hypothetical protein
MMRQGAMISSLEGRQVVRCVVAGLVVSIALTACTSSGSSPSGAASSPAPRPATQTAPPARTLPGTIALAVDNRLLRGVLPPGSRAALVSSTRLAMVTAGSGSCPWLPTKLVVVDPTAIQMYLKPYGPSGGACTADLTTTNFEVAVDPAQIDVSHDLTIHVVYSTAGRVFSRGTVHAAAFS